MLILLLWLEQDICAESANLVEFHDDDCMLMRPLDRDKLSENRRGTCYLRVACYQ